MARRNKYKDVIVEQVHIVTPKIVHSEAYFYWEIYLAFQQNPIKSQCCSGMQFIVYDGSGTANCPVSLPLS